MTAKSMLERIEALCRKYGIITFTGILAPGEKPITVNVRALKRIDAYPVYVDHMVVMGGKSVEIMVVLN